MVLGGRTQTIPSQEIIQRMNKETVRAVPPSHVTPRNTRMNESGHTNENVMSHM